MIFFTFNPIHIAYITRTTRLFVVIRAYFSEFTGVASVVMQRAKYGLWLTVTLRTILF